MKLPNNKRSTRIIIYNYNLDKVSVGYLSDNPEIRIFSPASDVKIRKTNHYQIFFQSQISKSGRS